MDTELILVGVFVVVCIILFYCYSRHEYFSNKPTEREKQLRSKDLYDHKATFQKGYGSVKRKLPWLDPVTYEDARYLLVNNNFNTENIVRIFD